RAGAASVYAGLAAGILVAAQGALAELDRMGVALPGMLLPLRFPYDPSLVIALSNIASFGVGAIVCLLVPARQRDPRLSATLWDLRRTSGDAEGENLARFEPQGGAFPVTSELRE